MSEEQKHTSYYSSEDIHLYLSGKLTPAQMHAMEKAALNDPLLADAIEGYDELAGFKNEEGLGKVQSDLAELRQRIDATSAVVKMGKQKSRWWQVAAAAIIITGAFALYQLTRTTTKDEIIIAKNDAQPGNITDEKTTIVIPPVIKADTNSKITFADVKTQNGLTTIEVTPKLSEMKEVSATRDTVARPYYHVDANTKDFERDQIVSRKKAANNNAVRNEEADKYYDSESAGARNLTQNFSGRVLDDNANAVPFADIVINNTRESKTDANGMFNINLADTVAQITAVAKNYRATTTNINARNYNTIILSPKKIILKKAEEPSKNKSFAKKQLHRSIVMVLNKNTAEPVEGWLKFEQHFVDLLSGSEYDDGKPVFGEMIVNFDVNQGLIPVNFVFERSINSDVDEAIETLIKNESTWKAVEDKSLPGTVKLKIIF